MSTCPNNIWNHAAGCTCATDGRAVPEVDIDLGNLLASCPRCDGTGIEPSDRPDRETGQYEASDCPRCDGSGFDTGYDDPEPPPVPFDEAWTIPEPRRSLEP